MFERVGVFCAGERSVHKKIKIKGTTKLIEDLNDGELPLMGRGSRIPAQTVARAEGLIPSRYVRCLFQQESPYCFIRQAY